MRRALVAAALVVGLAAGCVRGGGSWGLGPPATALARARAGSVLGPATDFVGSELPAVARRGLFPVHDDCEVGVLAGGEDAYALRIALAARATTSLRVQVLIFEADEAGLRLARLLKDRRAAGVAVHVIVDALSNTDWQSQWMYFDLEQHGVEVEGYEALGLQWWNELPFGTPAGTDAGLDQRFHEKLWIVDGETDHAVAITGGLNLANEYFRVDPTHVERYWRDQDVVVRGPVVADLVAAFDRNVEYFEGIKASRGVLDSRPYWRAFRALLDGTGRPTLRWDTRPDRVAKAAALEARVVTPDYQPARCRFFQSRPRLHESYLQQAYLQLLAGARKSVAIANAYFVPTPSLRAALVDAARRCVAVTVLTNGPETVDTPGLTEVGRTYFAELLAVNDEPAVRACPAPAGLRLFEWQGKRAGDPQATQGMMHGKYAVVDDALALVGSHNLDPRSERLNSESGLAFASPTLARQLTALFVRDLGWAREIGLAEARGFARPPKVLTRLKLQLGKVFEDQL